MTKNENRDFPPIPIEWIIEHGISLTIGKNRKYDSSAMALVFGIIADWKEEHKNDQ